MATPYSHRQASEEDVHLSTNDADVLNLLRDTSGNGNSRPDRRPQAWLKALLPQENLCFHSSSATVHAGLPEGQQHDFAYSEASGAKTSQVPHLHTCCYQ